LNFKNPIETRLTSKSRPTRLQTKILKTAKSMHPQPVIRRSERHDEERGKEGTITAKLRTVGNYARQKLLDGMFRRWFEEGAPI
jgi:hypothetical protein